jgi:FkbM family methyltransferase
LIAGGPENVGEHCAITTSGTSGNGKVYCGSDVQKHQGQGVKADVVPVQTLQDVLNEAGVMDFEAFKMDVEGFECRVLAGAPDLAKKYTLNYFVMETTNEETKRCGAKFAVEGGFEVLHNRADLIITRGNF